MEDLLLFESRAEFRKWLEKNASSHPGVWLVFSKNKKLVTVTAPEALEEALCFGWIDGLMTSLDETRYKKYFAKRRKDSVWSDKNKLITKELISKGIMTQAGLDAIETAKKNGQWDKVRDRTISDAQMKEFEGKVRPSKAAFDNYSNMPKSTREQFCGFYFEAKREETREKRLEKIIGLLLENRKLMG